jgi:hypothetical protein
MNAKEIPYLLHVSVGLLHESTNMFFDGIYPACTVKYVACTENTLYASPNMLLDGRYIACMVKYVACTENTLHAMEIQ